jgi:hypothetical protein
MTTRGRACTCQRQVPASHRRRGMTAADPGDNEFCVMPEIGLKGDC